MAAELSSKHRSIRETQFAKYAYGMSLLSAGDFEGAFAAFTEVIAIAPDSLHASLAYRRRAEVYRRWGRDEDAEADLKAAEEIRAVSHQTGRQMVADSNVHQPDEETEARRRLVRQALSVPSSSAMAGSKVQTHSSEDYNVPEWLESLRFLLPPLGLLALGLWAVSLFLPLGGGISVANALLLALLFGIVFPPLWLGVLAFILLPVGALFIFAGKYRVAAFCASPAATAGLFLLNTEFERQSGFWVALASAVTLLAIAITATVSDKSR